MSEFFNNLKADLTDRRLMPLVALVVIAVVAAVGWALLSGGSSSSSTTVHAVVLPTGPAPGLATTTVTPEKALAETATGYAAQRHGSARNPFLPLPGSGTATASSRSAATASTASTSSTASSSSTSSSGSGSSSASTTPAKPSTPKTKTVYRVAVLFGSIPAGTTPANAQLTAYENLKPATPLPDAKNPLVVYRGVTQGKKASATFTIVGEVILHGEGSCLPEPQNCAAINLAPGQVRAARIHAARRADNPLRTARREHRVGHRDRGRREQAAERERPGTGAPEEPRAALGAGPRVCQAGHAGVPLPPCQGVPRPHRAAAPPRPLSPQQIS